MGWQSCRQQHLGCCTCNGRCLALRGSAWPQGYAMYIVVRWQLSCTFYFITFRWECNSPNVCEGICVIHYVMCGEGLRSLWRRLLDFTQADPIREGQLVVYERLRNRFAKPIREASRSHPSHKFWPCEPPSVGNLVYRHFLGLASYAKGPTTASFGR